MIRLMSDFLARFGAYKVATHPSNPYTGASVPNAQNYIPFVAVSRTPATFRVPQPGAHIGMHPLPPGMLSDVPLPRPKNAFINLFTRPVKEQIL